MYKKIALAAILALLATYFFGPKPNRPTYTAYTSAVTELNGAALANYIDSTEKLLPVKPNNEAKIIWANDSSKQKTKYAIVYLPGFSASREEGAPTHTNIAKQFGCNIYLARLAEHGLISDEPLLNLTAEAYWKSAVEALHIGEQLGDSVILMSTSTGGTFALLLCGNETLNKKIAANILLSPNVEIYDGKAGLLNNHWGLQTARLVMGGNYILSSDQRAEYKKYWYSKYRIEGAVAVQELIETGMNNTLFEKITQPTLLMYYYKNEEEQDKVVKVSAMKNMFEKIKTPTNLKVQAAIAGAGDHVIGGYLKSKDLLSVNNEIVRFLKKQKGM